jgi:hypothetical protein
MKETSATHVMPATMTPVAWDLTTGPPLCGVTRTTTGY